ncbi:hypothetical protein ACFSRY_16115 [Pontibacter locisalis]|uniref:Uncharacterized protein n=1 Tax=Pontibacter locisalis TaxID=1719035 RepID=A0ABW5IP33_9BACT
MKCLLSCSSELSTSKGNTYHFCYDYGYLLLEGEKVLVVNWQPYMEK